MVSILTRGNFCALAKFLQLQRNRAVTCQERIASVRAANAEHATAAKSTKTVRVGYQPVTYTIWLDTPQGRVARSRTILTVRCSLSRVSVPRVPRPSYAVSNMTRK